MYFTALVIGIIIGYFVSQKIRNWDGNIIIGSKIDIGEMTDDQYYMFSWRLFIFNSISYYVYGRCVEKYGQ